MTWNIGKKYWFILSILVVLVIVGCVASSAILFKRDLQVFVTPGARVISEHTLGSGMVQLQYEHNGPLDQQSAQLHQLLDDHRFYSRYSLLACDDACLQSGTMLVYERRHLNETLSETITIQRYGASPYVTELTWRRCVRIPFYGCWPAT